jgi:hypothetical protein
LREEVEIWGRFIVIQKKLRRFCDGKQKFLLKRVWKMD